MFRLSQSLSLWPSPVSSFFFCSRARGVCDGEITTLEYVCCFCSSLSFSLSLSMNRRKIRRLELLCLCSRKKEAPGLTLFLYYRYVPFSLFSLSLLVLFFFFNLWNSFDGLQIHLHFSWHSLDSGFHFCKYFPGFFFFFLVFDCVLGWNFTLEGNTFLGLGLILIVSLYSYVKSSLH